MSTVCGSQKQGPLPKGEVATVQTTNWVRACVTRPGISLHPSALYLYCTRTGQMQKYPEKAPTLTPDFLIQVGARHEEPENPCPDWYRDLDASGVDVAWDGRSLSIWTPTSNRNTCIPLSPVFWIDLTFGSRMGTGYSVIHVYMPPSIPCARIVRARGEVLGRAENFAWEWNHANPEGINCDQILLKRVRVT